MFRLLTIILSLALLSSGLQAAPIDLNKVIYGEDDRDDVYAANDNLHIELANSTAAMVSRSQIDQSRTSTGYTLKGSSLQSGGMCATERFAKQPTVARCSGFLVGEDLLVTAGHCVRGPADCSGYSWVFNYRMSEEGDRSSSTSVSVGNDDVYHCSQILEQSLDRATMDDYALVRLDRKVVGRAPLRVRTEGKVQAGTDLVVIGHPSGLPTKISNGAIVRDNSNKYYFVSNLDTYGGNSGSAVFDSKTGIVEGILVRGETDYTYDRTLGCRVSYRCTDEGCRGEDVTRITNIKALRSL